jgi:hypothetical protein
MGLSFIFEYSESGVKMKRILLALLLTLGFVADSGALGTPTVSQTFFDGQNVSADDMNGIESQWVNYIINSQYAGGNVFTIPNADSILVLGRIRADTSTVTGLFIVEAHMRPSNDGTYSIGATGRDIDSIYVEDLLVAGTIQLATSITADSLSLTSGMKGVGGIFITSAGDDTRSTIDSVSVVDLIVSSTAAFSTITGTTITGSGVMRVDDATESTSTTSGSFHTDGGIAWTKDAYVGDDMFMTAAGVINWGAGDVTVTGGTNILTVAGGTLATAALTTSTIVASGVVKTDDATEASNTTTASLQTDGGVAWVKDAYVGDDMFFTDGAVLNFVSGAETITHSDGTLAFGGFGTTITMNTPILDLVTQGNRIDLDTDNDTSIRASTDDVIKIEAGGVDIVTINEFGIGITSSPTIDIPFNFGVGGRTHTDNTNVTFLNVAATGAQIIPSSTTATYVGTAAFSEPNITATGTVTNAFTVRIANAPDEGTNSYALWVDDGATQLDGTLAVAGDLTLSAGADGAINFSVASSIKILDNSATSLVIEEANNAYLTFVTANSGEKITLGKKLEAGAVEIEGTAFDINGGTMDAVDVTVGSGKTLDVSAGTLTLDDDQISGNAINGGTIGSTTITTLTTTDISVADDVLITSAGSVVNWASGDITLTQSAGKLTFGGDAAVEIDFATHEMTNVDINSGTIDGTAIAGSSGSFTTLAASATTTITEGATNIGLDLQRTGSAGAGGKQLLYIYSDAAETGAQLVRWVMNNASSSQPMFRMDNAGSGATIKLTGGAWTEALEFFDAGRASATEQDWITVKVGGETGYIRVYASK